MATQDYYKLLERNPRLVQSLFPEWSDYIPQYPTAKQLAFLMLPHREAFFGGAAGGGKSSALLMGALQYVDIPGYSAIIFRKTFADLNLQGALIDRSMQWLSGTDARWDSMQHCWRFPSGAQVAFGYIQNSGDRFRYQGAEFQYIGFDELTQHFEEDYLYLFSRLRRLKGYPVPLRMRSASNPGGLGHEWVKDRFKIESCPCNISLPEKIGKLIHSRFLDHYYRGTIKHRPHVPAFVWDNDYLDVEEYIRSLLLLDPVTREQLLRGDWGVTADGRFKKSWFKYFSTQGDYVVLGPDRHGTPVHRNRCRVFQTIDPAASVRQGPGDSTIWQRQPSKTVISTWIVTPQYDLLWIGCRVFSKEVPEVIHEIVEEFKLWKSQNLQPDFIGIEANGLGIGVYQVLQRAGLPVRNVVGRSVDKLVRATDAMVRAENGKVYLLQNAEWLGQVESQLFTWTGHPQQNDDIIDTLSYAAIHVSSLAVSTGQVFTSQSLPIAYGSYM